MKNKPLLIKWSLVTHATLRFYACFSKEQEHWYVCLEEVSSLGAWKPHCGLSWWSQRVDGTTLSLWGWGALPSQCGQAAAGWNKHRMLSFIYSLRATDFVWNCGRIMPIALQFCANRLVPALTVSFFASSLATKQIKKGPPIFLMSAWKPGQYFLQSEPAGKGICIAWKILFF